MAFDIGAAFGGFAQGLGQGVQSGVNIAQRQQQLELARTEQKLKYVDTINNMRKWSPEMRAQFGKPFLKQLGKSVGVEMGDVALEAFAKGDQKLVEKMADYWATRVKGGAQLKELLAEMSDPEKIAAFGAKIDESDIRRETAAETKRHHRATEGIASANLAETRAERAERRAEREQTQVSTAHRDILDNASKNLTGPGVTDYEKKLSESQAYAAAVKARNTKAMYDIASKIRQGVTPENYAAKGQNDLSVIQELRTRYTGLAQSETDPVKKKKYQELAERYDRLERFGGKEIPQTHLDFLESASTATTWISKTANILNDPARAQVLSPRDRAEVAQAVQGMKLELATLAKRGANFTDSEQRMIEATMGGNPNDILSRGLRNRADFIERLRTIHSIIQSKVQSRERGIISGKATIAPFPNVSSGTTKSGLKFREE